MSQSTFISHQAPNSEDIRNAIKVELLGKVTVDSEQILRRLHTEAVPASFVASFLHDFEDRNIDAISALKDIVADAEGSGKQPKKADEKRMYLHLQTIFDDITNFDPASAKYKRRFYNTAEKVKGETHLSGFPSVSPDFGCGTIPVDPQKLFTWRGMDSFLEVKPSSSQGVIPKNPDKETVLKTLAQTADYGRLHMSSRPFQLFSVAVVISGFKFVVAIFDRDGATVSSDFDMWSDTEVFVRVIRQIACGLSPVELGADPSVQELKVNSPLYQQILKKSAALCVPSNFSGFPSYRITCPRQLRPRPATPYATTRDVSWVSDLWVTIGPPIWSSLTLCGRATTVWRVTRMENRILKNSWRRSDRDSESDIYQSIPIHPVGVAEFLQGGDATVPGSNDIIRIDNLRTTPTPTFAPSGQPTLILHRLVLKTTGRALWEGDSFLEIVKGVRAALKGHKSLCAQNILHRDISPGNILLSADPYPKPGEEGFLTDLEFARLQTIVKQDIQEHPLKNDDIAQSKHVQWQDAKRGAAMTGTLHFMAVELVHAMADNRQIEHKVHHDVESFIWFFAYAVARRLINVSSNVKEPDVKKHVSSFFADAWAGASVTSVLMAKRALFPILPPLDICHLIPAPILSLFDTLQRLMPN
ncbi:hypothetical protein HGRIS_011764 [Hohenbuehelia grisea]|uniref:Protein kinase domain-containing protein n=1 Tax=Hohenbuehelia grisea TaxID=104357 RepID=A0ABR3JW37_9AGAR